MPWRPGRRRAISESNGGGRQRPVQQRQEDRGACAIRERRADRREVRIAVHERYITKSDLIQCGLNREFVDRTCQVCGTVVADGPGECSWTGPSRRRTEPSSLLPVLRLRGRRTTHRAPGRTRAPPVSLASLEAATRRRHGRARCDPAVGPRGSRRLLAGWARRRGIGLARSLSATRRSGARRRPRLRGRLRGGDPGARRLATRSRRGRNTPARHRRRRPCGLLGARRRHTRLDGPAIGWREVESADPARVPQGPWLTCQEQAMTPPPLSYELAWNRDGTQAFCLRRHLAVQFHPEATAQLVVAWAAELEAAGLDAGALSGGAPSVPAASVCSTGRRPRRPRARLTTPACTGRTTTGRRSRSRSSTRPRAAPASRGGRAAGC